MNELQQLIKTMGERMTNEEISQLAKHVDSDGSGEIDMDELKILMRPMMSLSDRAAFAVTLEPAYGICGGGSELVVSGIGIALTPKPMPMQVPPCQCVQCTGSTSTFSFSKISDMDESEGGIDLVVKLGSGALAKIAVTCDAETRTNIMLASKKQNGKLSLRSAIARSKEPTDSTIGTALVVLKTESLSRTSAQLNMLHKYLSSADLFEVMELETDLLQKQCCRYLHAERYAAGDVIFEEGSL